MKVLVVHATAGAGHTKAAEAIYKHLVSSRKDIDTKILDILDTTTPWFQFSYRRGYWLLVKLSPVVWAAGFWLTYIKALRPFTRALASVFNRINTTGFAKLLIRENPDLVISTFFLSSEIAGHLRSKGRIASRVVNVITDFGVHPFWISPGIDTYVAASDDTRRILIDEGVNAGSIRTFGIPVDEKFLRMHDKPALLNKLGLKSAFTVLLVTGSFGIGPLEKIADSLKGEAQVLVVCARNRQLYKRLLNKQSDSLRAFGFVDNLDELMAVSDVIVTKPGGLSIAESLAMGLFPIFISAIPGQETENVRILSTRGVGITGKGVDFIKRTVAALRDDPEKLRAARIAIDKVKKPFAARDICDEC